MNKSIKIIYTTILFIFIFYSPVFSQNIKADYGQNATDATPFYPLGAQLSKDGFHPPLTRKDERMLRKAKSLSLSTKEKSILLRKENNKELTFYQKLKYPFIKRKNDKLEKLKEQANNSSNSPSYLQKADKYRLSYNEEDIINKAKTDSLSEAEQKVYKKALKKQEKYQKEENKFKIDEITEDEKKLLIKEHNHKKDLTPSEKKDLKEIHKKQKQNQKAKDRKHKIQVDSAVAAGAWLPVSNKKFSIKNFVSKIRRKRVKLSSYSRKLNRINKRYELTENQKKAYNRKISGLFITKKEKKLASKAYAKNWYKKEKTKKLLKKEFLKTQTPNTRKMIKATRKKSENLRKRKKTNKIKTIFGNLFKKRK